MAVLERDIKGPGTSGTRGIARKEQLATTYIGNLA
jgi:hypothetical protein